MRNKKLTVLAGPALFACVALAGATLDFESNAKPSKWFIYPQKKGIKTTLSSEKLEGKSVLEVDFRTAGGHARVPLPHNGRRFISVSFKIKGLADAKRKSIDLMLVEADNAGGEKYYKTLKFNGEWQNIKLKASDLRIFPYGGAKVVDGRIDADHLQYLQFNAYPGGSHFLVSDIQLEYGDAVPAAAENGQKKKTAAEVSRIEKIQMPAPGSAAERTFAGSQITLKDNVFYRNGKPAFVLGGWQVDNDAALWVMRLFQVDTVTYNADGVYNLFAPKKGPDGKYVIKWSATPWYSALLKRFNENKINFWHEHKAHPRYTALRHIPELKELLDAGHFVNFDPFHPMADDLYAEMFKSWMRYTVKQPVFCYEVFNEMGYDNTHPISRRAFAAKMQKKYNNDIAAANKAWGTSFKSFGEVEPPGFIVDHGKNPLPRDLVKQREGWKYPNLVFEWRKFQEDRCYEAVGRLMKLMRSYDPDPQIFSTIQSHMNLWLDFADTGVKPETLRDFSDFISHEAPGTFVESGNVRSYANIIAMLKLPFVNEIVRFAAQGKPIINAESPFGVKNATLSPAELQELDLADMHNNWRFFDATEKLPADWFAAGFNDRSWSRIKVPGLWGENGHPKCQVGLYRKTIEVPADALKKDIFLNGHGFADDADIYLNGQKLGEAHGYNAQFTLSLKGKLKPGKNTLAVKIVNRYWNSNMFYGGIRGFVSVNHAPLIPEKLKTVEAKHSQAFLWSQAVHGMQGVMVCYSESLFRGNSRILPQVKSELESVADLLFKPENRPAASTALLYPQETFRGIVHKEYLERLNAPATNDLLPYYTSLLFNQHVPDVIRHADLAEKLANYKLLVLPDNLRMSEKNYKIICDYVKNGGNILLNHASLTTDDETHAARDTRKLTGVIEKGAMKKSNTVGGFKTTLRYIDKSSGQITQNVGAVPFADGLATVFKYGKGNVYRIGAQLPPEGVKKVLCAVTADLGLTPQLTAKPVNGQFAPEWADIQLFRNADGTTLLYVCNYDQPGMLRLFIPGLNGDQRVRFVAGGPFGKTRIMKAADLAKGIPLKLEQFQITAILFEPVAKQPRKLAANISPLRKEMLEELWRSRPEIPGAPRVALLPIPGMTPGIRGVVPTLKRLLEVKKYNVDDTVFVEDPSKYDVIIIQSPRKKFKNPEKIVEFVRQGGGLLICDHAFLNYHCGNNIEPLMKKFGLRRSFGTLMNKPGQGDDLLAVECKITDPKHPLSTGVKSIVTAGANHMHTYPKDAAVLVKSPADCAAPNRVFALSFQYGKGRVVYIGDHWMLRPLYFEKGDNAQFICNIVDHLAGRPIKPLTAEEKAEGLFITAEKLEQAENDEAAGRTVSAYPQETPTYLQGSSVKLKGLAGGDPIVDML